MEVISNDGQVAYTEDGEEWRFDRQWYAQNETKKVADLIHHELVKESETIESTSEVIESVPSTSSNKADMVEDTSSSTSTLFSEKTSVPTQISTEKRKGGTSNKLVESSSVKADEAGTEVKEKPQNHKSNESAPKFSQKEDNLSTLTEGENTGNDEDGTEARNSFVAYSKKE